MEIVPLKCSVCGAAIENYHGQSEVKCSYCGAIQEVEPKGVEPVRNKTTLTAAIIILVIIVLFGAISVSLDMGTKHSFKPIVRKDSSSLRNKDTNGQLPKKTDNEDPLNK